MGDYSIVSQKIGPNTKGLTDIFTGVDMFTKLFLHRKF